MRLFQRSEDEQHRRDLNRLAQSVSLSRANLSAVPSIAARKFPSADNRYREQLVSEVTRALDEYRNHITASLLKRYDTKLMRDGSDLHLWAQERFPWMTSRTRSMQISRGLTELR